MGVGGAGAAYTAGGSVFPTEKGIQPLVPILRNPNNTSVTPGMLQEQPEKLARLACYSRVVPCPPPPHRGVLVDASLAFYFKKRWTHCFAKAIIKINDDLGLLSIFTSNRSYSPAQENFQHPKQCNINSGAIRWYMTAGNEVELHCPAKQNGLICFHWNAKVKYIVLHFQNSIFHSDKNQELRNIRKSNKTSSWHWGVDFLFFFFKI